MFDPVAFLYGLGGILAAALVVWAISVLKRDVSIVDSLWSLLFLIAASIYLGTAPAPGLTSILVLVMVGLWALRLTAYITWRNWGEEEDRRYQHIRERNQPGFAYKSLYLVFGLQGVLAWIISLPLWRRFTPTRPWTGWVIWASWSGWSAWCSRRAATGNWPVLKPTRTIEEKCWIPAFGAIAGIRITLATRSSGGAFFCSPFRPAGGGPWLVRF